MNLGSMMCPKWMGRKAYLGFGEMMANANKGLLGKGVKPGKDKNGREFKGHPEKADDWTLGSPIRDPGSKVLENWMWNDINGSIRAEMGSCGMSGSARGLAKVAAMVANGGTWDGVEYISPEVHE